MSIRSEAATDFQKVRSHKPLFIKVETSGIQRNAIMYAFTQK